MWHSQGDFSIGFIQPTITEKCIYTISYWAEAVPRFPDVTWHCGIGENERGGTHSRGVVSDPVL